MIGDTPDLIIKKKTANEALKKCGDAEAKHKVGDYQNVKVIALKGMEALKMRYDFFSVQ